MQRTLLLALIVGLGSFLGCRIGPDYGPTGTVAGKLTMDGKPLAAQTNVVFMHPEKGYLAYATTDAEGKFQITGWHDGNQKNGPELPVGIYRVMIQPPASQTAEPTAEEMLANPRPQAPKVEFPQKYRQTHTSGLEYEIKPGANDFPIDLKSA